MFLPVIISGILRVNNQSMTQYFKPRLFYELTAYALLFVLFRNVLHIFYLK